MISMSNISLVCSVFTSTNEFTFYPVSVYLSDSRISKKYGYFLMKLLEDAMSD